MYIILFLSFILMTFSEYVYNGSNDRWWHHWSYLAVAISIIISINIYKKFHWSAALAFLAIMLNFIYAFCWYDNQYAHYPINSRIIIDRWAAMGAFYFLIIVFALLNSEKYYKNLEKVFLAVCVLNCLYVIYQAISGNAFLSRGGICGNGSINGTLIAFTFPLVFAYRSIKIRGIVILLCLISLFLTKTSIPIGVFLVCYISLIYLNLSNTRDKILIMLGMTLLILLIGYLIDPNNFFSDARRFEMYYIIVQSFYNKVNMWIGTGLSTFPFFGPVMQIENNYQVGAWFLWAHSDWLQLLFESGIVSIIIYINLFFWMLYYTVKQKRYYLTSCTLGYGAAMVFNYPLHYPIQSFFGCYLVVAILLREKKECYRLIEKKVK